MPQSTVRLPSRSDPTGIVAERFARDGQHEFKILVSRGWDAIVNAGRIELVDDVIPPEVQRRCLLAMQGELLKAEAEGLLAGFGEDGGVSLHLVP